MQSLGKKKNIYNVQNNNHLKLLQKGKKFRYVDRYTGKESKHFKKLFNHPAFQTLLDKYPAPPLLISQIAILGSRGLGVLAAEDIRLEKKGKPKGLGIYWGELSHEFTHLSHYVFMVSKYEIDAKKDGNWTRFVNHSKGNYNVIALQKSWGKGKMRLPYIEYALIKDVKAGEQLLVDYGPEYEFDHKHQVFLNPSNNLLSVEELFEKNKKNYMPMKGKLFNWYKKLDNEVETLYGPTDYLDLLIKNRKKKKMPKVKKQQISTELPILRADKRGNIVADSFQQGITSLMLAAYIGAAQAVDQLIKTYSANSNQQNIRTGYNALFYAIQSPSKPIFKNRVIKSLLSANIHLFTQDKDGFTVLHWCVKENNLSALKLIFENKKIKADAMEALDVLDRHDLCPIMYAISLGELKITEYLLDTFARYYNESYFHPRHNEWLLSVGKKIFKEYPHKNLPDMLKLLMRKGLQTNRKALSMLESMRK